MGAPKHGALWARYLELCEQSNHFDAVKQLAREQRARHEEMRRLITALRQSARRRGESVPDIPPELMRLAKLNGSRSKDHLAQSRVPTDLPPLQPVPPGAWNPAPLRALLIERGMTYTDLGRAMNGGAKAGGYARSLVTGERRYPTLATLQKVAGALDVSLDAIRGDYTPPDKYDLLFGRKTGKAPRLAAPARPRVVEPVCPVEPTQAAPGKVEPPPGMVKVESLDDFLGRLDRAAGRARKRRLARAAGLLHPSALQCRAQELADALRC